MPANRQIIGMKSRPRPGGLILPSPSPKGVPAEIIPPVPPSPSARGITGDELLAIIASTVADLGAAAQGGLTVGEVLGVLGTTCMRLSAACDGVQPMATVYSVVGTMLLALSGGNAPARKDPRKRT